MRPPGPVVAGVTRHRRQVAFGERRHAIGRGLSLCRGAAQFGPRGVRGFHDRRGVHRRKVGLRAVERGVGERLVESQGRAQGLAGEGDVVGRGQPVEFGVGELHPRLGDVEARRQADLDACRGPVQMLLKTCVRLVRDVQQPLRGQQAVERALGVERHLGAPRVEIEAAGLRRGGRRTNAVQRTPEVEQQLAQRHVRGVVIERGGQRAALLGTAQRRADRPLLVRQPIGIAAARQIVGDALPDPIFRGVHLGPPDAQRGMPFERDGDCLVHRQRPGC